MNAPAYIDFLDDGTIEIHTPGLKGVSCKDKTKFLEDLGVVISDTKTAQYYQIETTVQQQTTIRRT